MSCVRRHGPGWLAIGDAAGFVNPMNGEGIDYGLESGMLAVEQFLVDPGRGAGRRTTDSSASGSTASCAPDAGSAS